MPRTKVVTKAPSKPIGRAARKSASHKEVEISSEPHAPARKRKPRQLTTEERLDRLERRHAALIVKLRPHGIHLPPDDEDEMQPEIQAQEDASTE